jgi:hypothetical protein
MIEKWEPDLTFIFSQLSARSTPPIESETKSKQTDRLVQHKVHSKVGEGLREEPVDHVVFT